MTREHLPTEDRASRVPKPETHEAARQAAPDASVDSTGLVSLQRQVGNEAVQRLLAQRAASAEGFTTDEGQMAAHDKAASNTHQMSGGALADVENATGLSLDVQETTSNEATGALQANAYTVGNTVVSSDKTTPDVKKHELAHVVQNMFQAKRETTQRSSSGMEVTAANHPNEAAADNFVQAVNTVNSKSNITEQDRASVIATAVPGMGAQLTEQAQAQRNATEDEELQEFRAQRNAQDEEELQESRAQRNAVDEEELQESRAQRNAVDEEELQESRAQRNAVDEEELQEFRAQRNAQDEEELQEFRAQRNAEEEVPEEFQAFRAQRNAQDELDQEEG